MIEYNVEIQGTTSLLFNRFVDASIDTEVKKRAGSVKKQEPKDKLYVLPDGKVYTPSTHIMGMLVNAGKNFKIQGKMKANYSKLIGSAVEVNPDCIEHKIQSWIPFSISAVNPMTRGRMMVTRPMMDKWKLEFNIKFNENDIPTDVMKNILDFGGQYVGIGDWRPEKKGKYGKFIVTKFKEVE